MSMTPTTLPTVSITREIYEGFQRGEFDRWDQVIAQDVEIYSPGYWGGKGIVALKTWGAEFLKALQPRIDLIDEFESGDPRLSHCELELEAY